MLMPKSVGQEIAGRFKGEKRLAAAIDEAVAAARATESQDWRQRLIAVVIECGTLRRPGPHHLLISRRAVEAASQGGELSEIDLPAGRLLMYKPPDPRRPPPKSWPHTQYPAPPSSASVLGLTRRRKRS
jgi:hypothetical protein